MNDWFRSLTALGMAFVSVVAITLGLALVIVPRPAVSSQPTESGQAIPSATPRASAATGGIPGLGGVLTVTGDREGTFHVNRESSDGRFGVTGDEGRIFFEGDPLTVAQLNFDGLSFFPEPDACSITTGNLSSAIGIGMADVQCDELTDVRGNGVIGVTGSLGFPLDLLVARELPPSGGSVAVGEETWEFAEALLATWRMPAIAGRPEYSMALVADGRTSALNFSYDVETHILALANVEQDGEGTDVPDHVCGLRTRELGKVNPRTTVIELTIECAEVDVPGLGPVAITGTVVIDRFEFPT